MKYYKLIPLLSLLLFGAGCSKPSEGGTTTGNPLINFKMTASSSVATVAYQRPPFLSPWWTKILTPAMALPPPTMQDSNAFAVTLSEAWIVVKEVEFKSSETVEAGEVDGDAIAFVGPTVVNLLSNTPESFGQGRIGSSVIRRVKMKLHKAADLPASAPVSLLEKSVFWKGSVNGHDFTISSAEGYEYEVSGATGVPLSDNANVLLSIHIANLFKKMDLSGINSSGSQVDIDEAHRFPATSPCPSIDPSAADLYTCFTRGMTSESNLGHDENEDGELENEDAVK